MKILVAGGAEYLGSVTTEMLGDAEHDDVVVFDNLERGHREAIDPCRADDCTALVDAAAKAKTELGWNSQFADLETIVKSAWDWRRAHPRGYAEIA